MTHSHRQLTPPSARLQGRPRTRNTTEARQSANPPAVFATTGLGNTEMLSVETAEPPVGASSLGITPHPLPAPPEPPPAPRALRSRYPGGHRGSPGKAGGSPQSESRPFTCRRRLPEPGRAGASGRLSAAALRSRCRTHPVPGATERRSRQRSRLHLRPCPALRPRAGPASWPRPGPPREWLPRAPVPGPGAPRCPVCAEPREGWEVCGPGTYGALRKSAQRCAKGT